MTRPLASVARVASTPEQAKVFVALLQSEGIPAHVDGDSLTDEFAMSRRLMNLTSVRVMVPTASLERAREILTTEAIDEDELEQQALASPSPEAATASVFAASGPREGNPLLWPFVGATCIAIVFGVLWLDAGESQAATRDPLFDFVAGEDGTATYVRRSDGVAVYRWHDPDRNQIWHRIDTLAPDGSVRSSSFDDDQNGVSERTVAYRDNGWRETWTDADQDGRYDTGTVTDGNGAVLQRITWRPDTGFVIEKP
jgi:hypothetical protein